MTGGIGSTRNSSNTKARLIDRLQVGESGLFLAVINLGQLSGSVSAILLAAISVLIITSLDACSCAIAAELAGYPGVGTQAAISLRDNDLTILNSETTGVCIR
jgi:hypothetical protein